MCTDLEIVSVEQFYQISQRILFAVFPVLITVLC